MDSTVGSRLWRWAGAITVAVAVVLGGVACGDDGDAASDAKASTKTEADGHDHEHTAEAATANLPEKDPCTLVTKADAEGVLGPLSTVTESSAAGGTYGVVPDSRVCRMILASDGKFGATLGLTDHQAESKYKGMAKQFGETAVAVDGVGDDAVWIPPFRVLLALEGDALVSVQILETNPNFDAPDLKEKAIKLVTAALGGLPAN